ncbi:hydroxycarboxylic acid receptor 2-like [Mastacembelus armatus]|nr:hydroxycarboxylic acid receptor 2-like [Mastacembelus armatus]
MQCLFIGTLPITVLPPLLVTEFILGFLGNGLALWIFCFHLKPWKSSTVLLFNLAIADFLLNMALPFRASYYLSGIKWKFGNALCNICLFMLAVNRSGSTLFLMVIAVDRYMRVVHPHHSINSLSVSKAVLGALALWVLTIAMTAQIFTLQHPESTYCETFMIETEPSNTLIWYTFGFFISVFIPLFVILYCTIHIIAHLRGRQLAQHAKIKKALCFITVVVVLFIICFLPSSITLLLVLAKISNTPSTSSPYVCPDLESLTTAFHITISMTYLNSALDPVVYYFSSPGFKSICRKILHLPQADTVESTEKKVQRRKHEKQAPSQSASCDHKS